MQQIGTFSSAGTVANIDEIKTQRRKKGMCPECGEIKTHKVQMAGLKRTPLTHEYSMDGRCLRCFPLSAHKSRQSNALSSQSSRHSQQQQQYVSNGSSMYVGSSRSNASGSAGSTSMFQSQVRSSGITVNKRSYTYKKAMRESLRTGAGGSSITSYGSNSGSGVMVGSRLSTRPSNQSSRDHRDVSITSFKSNDSSLSVPRYDWKDSVTSFSEPRSDQSARQSFFQNKYVDNKNKQDDPFETLRKVKEELGKLSANDRAARSVGVSRRGLKVSESFRNVVKVMDGYDEEVLQEESMNVLLQTTNKAIELVENKETSEEDFLTEVSSILGGLCRSMQKNLTSEGIQDDALKILWAIASRSKTHVLLLQTGSVEVTMASMKHHSSCKQIQHKGCSILSNISSNENCLASIPSPFIDVLLDAMNKFVMDESLMLIVAGVIANLTVIARNQEYLIGQKSGLGIICDAMGTHGKNILLQEQSMKTLRNVSSGGERQKSAINEVEGIDTIVMLMRTHPMETKFQMLSCWTLSNLATSRPLKRKIAESEGLGLLVDALWEQEHDADVVEWACRALWSLSVDSQNKAEIGTNTGIDAIINGMSQHINVARVQEKACGALSNLAANSDDNKIIIANSEGIDAIKHAMESHPIDEGVQDKACHALKNLATENTVPLMMCLDVQSVLRDAVDRFPEKCGSRAEDVLDQIGQFGG